MSEESSNDFAGELGAMLGDSSYADTEAVGSTDVPEPEEAETSEATSSEEVPTDEVPEGVPDSSEEKSELEQKMEALETQNQKLMEQLNLLLEQQKTGEKKVEDTKVQELQDFLQGADVLDLTENGEKFNKFLNDFSGHVQQKTIEEILTKLPQVIMDYTNHQLTIRDNVSSFYESNPELQPMKKYVAKIMGDLSSENPEWPLAKVLDEGAKKAYEALGISKKKPSAKPAFTAQKTTKTTSSGEQLSNMEKEIASILEI